jgi:glycosyltransferase involved in cell wall biosynthesis
MNKPPMKITFILATLQGGGIQKVTIRLIREYLRMRIPTKLITIDSSGPMHLEIPSECELIELNSRRTRWAFWKLMSLLKQDKPEVIISAQTHLNVLVIIARILTGYPKKLIVVEHITFNDELIKRGPLFERIRPFLIRLFYPLTDRIVAVSPAAVRSIYQYARINKKIDMIWNGVDIDEICERSSQPVAHHWVNGNKRIVIAMGRLTVQKNFSALLNAFAMIEPIENHHLIILGEGPEYEHLQALAKELGIQDYVDFPGFVENPFAFLAQADLFVLSSRWEGFANVVIEALACGISIVATDCPGGPADILDNQPFARIVPVDNPKEMAAAMQILLSMKFDSAVISEYARNFNIQKVAVSYLELIREMQGFAA